MNGKFLIKRGLRAATASLVFVLAGCDLAGAADRTFNVPPAAVDTPLASAKGSQTLVLGGGCFWGVDAVFKHVQGVTSVTSGYAGGNSSTADYRSVSTGRTGHAESVQIVYDPSQVTLGQLLRVFFAVAHDPTELNYQGPDHGTQYRSVVFYRDADQKRVVEAYIAQLQAAKVYSAPIVTQVTALNAFFPAEDYHQNYLALHTTEPYIAINDVPKVEALRAKFPSIYNDSVNLAAGR